MRKSTKITAAIGGAALAVATTGVAYAYWTTNGSGAGSAVAGTNAGSVNGGLDIAQTSAITGLVPGGAAGTVSVTVKNLAGFAQNVGAVTPTVTSYPVACPAANWDVTGLAASAALGTLSKAGDPGDTAVVSVGTVSLNETGANQDACRLVSLPLTFTAAAGS